jgi:hypothetical protein
LTILERGVGDCEDEVMTAAADQLPFVTALPDIDEGRIRQFFDDCLASKCTHMKATIAKSLPLFSNVIPPDFVASFPAAEVKILAIESLKRPEIPSSQKLSA